MTHVTTFLRRALLAGTVLTLTAGGARAQTARPLAAPAPGAVTVKLMPLALADPTTPTLRAGAEYRLDARWGVEASYGLQMRTLGWGGAARVNDRYHKVHVEARHYVGGSPFYLAAAGFRVQQRFDVGAGTLYQNDQLLAYSSARVRRAITGGLVKAGVALPLADRWILDVAAGFGIRYGRITYATRELQPANPDSYELMDCGTKCGFSIDWLQTDTPGTFYRPTVALDLRLGYTLGR